MRKKILLVAFILLLGSGRLFAQVFTCYEDHDEDGFGNPNKTALSLNHGCPVGFVSDNSDCNDNNRDVHGTFSFYVDNDHDGYGAGNLISGICAVDANIPPAGYSTNNSDCDDNDPWATPQNQFWYFDQDKDGYITEASYNAPISQCDRPGDLNGGQWLAGAQVTSFLVEFDCNDNNKYEHPDQQWYVDADGDHYPGSLTPIVQCERPVGPYFAVEDPHLFKPLILDCTDNIFNPNPPEQPIAYKDTDNDGYSDGTSVISCSTFPEGYKKAKDLIATSGDCNDNENTVWQSKTLYIDNDGDGYDNGVETFCFGNLPLGYSLTTNGSDCNDNDSAAHPNQHWVPDNDHDGYQPLVLSITQCTRPQGYFAITELKSGFDCNDNNIHIHPGATETCDNADNNCNGEVDEGMTTYEFVLDADGDGYYPGTPIVQCSSPGEGYIVLTHIVSIGGVFSNKYPGDCDDNNAALNPASKWVVDADGDGYHPGSPIVQCISPGAGYILLTQILIVPVGLVPNKSPGDCDDNNILLNPATRWYKDTDDDRYSDGTTQTQCIRPAGHKLLSELTATTGDCNDDNADFNPATVWYKDTDNDRYSDGTPQTQCERPTGYKLLSELKSLFGNSFGDCDDDNGAIHPETVWYQDLDNDGYSNGFSAMTCGRATGWKLQTELTATAGDCNDNNIDINPATVWYKDADNDRYSDGTMQTQCAKPTGYKLPSELTATNGDCNDTEGLLNPTTVWYKDTDGDGYSNGATLTQCSRPANYKLTSELTATSGDCNDSDPGISPAAVEVCGNKVDDNCNGVVDEGTCSSCKNATNLKATSIMSTSAQISWSAIANPVQWQLQYKTTRPGSKWVDVLLTGNLRTYKLSSLSSNQNYQAQIRAKCGNTWTSYSAAVGFKTLGGGGSLSLNNVEANSILELDAEGSSTIMLHPNPTNGRFMLLLNVAEKINGKAQIQLTDITGKTVLSENAVMYNGALQKTITVSSTLAKGMYMVRVVVNNKTYKTPLIYAK